MSHSHGHAPKIGSDFQDMLERVAAVQAAGVEAAMASAAVAIAVTSAPLSEETARLAKRQFDTVTNLNLAVAGLFTAFFPIPQPMRKQIAAEKK